MYTKRVVISVLFALLLSVAATGCLSISAEELYSLPEVSEEYLRLQAHINMLLNRGYVFAAPARGQNRQAVQLKDINGDGSNEVVAFFSFPGDSKLLIYVFTMDEGDDYIPAGVIESVGTEIESVRYIDMDGDGNMELIIGWQMGSTLKYMSIYSMVDFHSQLIVNGDEYSEITAFNSTGTGGEDVVVLKLPSQEAGNAAAVIYSLMPDGEIVTEEARLSAGIESVARIMVGRLADNTPALFVESEGRFDNGSLVTDVLAIRNGSFANISLMPATGISADTVRHRMNSSDIMGGGIIYVPELRRLTSRSETEYYVIDWYAFRSDGSRILSLTTYHNTFDEWYLILPRDWRGKVSVRREDTVPGERTIIFSYISDPDLGQYDDFLKVYRISGDDIPAASEQDSRVVLLTEGSTAYAFEILVPENSFGISLTEAMVKENFRLIRAEWQPG